MEYLFGDVITGLVETADGVRVDFARAASRIVDLVVGADGLHSGVRRLVLGPESAYVRHLGYHLAGWDLPNELGVDTVSRQYNVPGRMAGVAADQRDPDRAGALVVFAAPRLDFDWRDLDQQKKLVADAFAGLGWHVPHLLAHLRDAPELYFDSISRVSVPRWHTGRTVLLGDAAWGVTLGGMGVGTGVVGAYVLAGELALAGGDHRVAFPAYESRLRGYAMRWQRGASPGRSSPPPPGGGWGCATGCWPPGRSSRCSSAAPVRWPPISTCPTIRRGSEPPVGFRASSGWPGADRRRPPAGRRTRRGWPASRARPRRGRRPRSRTRRPRAGRARPR
nr:hypothetical protein [Micromonospora sp. ATA51]